MNNTERNAIGAMLYQSDLKERPAYPDGSNRPAWGELQQLAKWTWTKDASALIAAARDWLASCAWSDMDATEIEALPADRVALGIVMHYSGGLLAFERAEAT